MGYRDVVAALRPGSRPFSQARALDDDRTCPGGDHVETTGLPPACTEDALGEPGRAALTSTGGTRTIRTSTITNFDPTNLTQRTERTLHAPPAGRPR
jgi:hypothetical protein